MLTISQVAKQLNINIQTIYFYERKGLIPKTQRSEGNYRLFTDQDIQKLTFILRTKKLGLTIEEIRDLLKLQEDNNLSCQEVYQRLLKKIQQIEQQIEQLNALKQELLPLAEKAKINSENKSCVIFSEDKV